MPRNCIVAQLALVASVLLVVGCGDPHGPDDPDGDGPVRTPRTVIEPKGPDERTLTEPGFLLGGIQINEPEIDHWLATLEQTGFDTVSLTVYAKHGLWNSGEIDFDVDPSWLVPEIRAARRRGLRVALIVRVALDHGIEENSFYWHGMIMPKTDDELAAWFARYGEFVGLWADVAEREGVDLFGIGSELNSLTSTSVESDLPALEEYYLNLEKQARERARTLASAADLPEDALAGELYVGSGAQYDDLESFLDDRSAANHAWAVEVTAGGDVDVYNQRRAALLTHWTTLVSDVRARFRGPITYAANFDQYQQVAFWDQLDIMGINAYFPLRSDLTETDLERLAESFEQSWERIFHDVDTFRAARGFPEMPVVFTELGYTRRGGATLEPWSGGGFGVAGGHDDPETAEMAVWKERSETPLERAYAVRALRRVHVRRPGLLAGLLWWKLTTVLEHRDIEAFVLLLQQGDPLEKELVAFREPAKIDQPGF